MAYGLSAGSGAGGAVAAFLFSFLASACVSAGPGQSPDASAVPGPALERIAHNVWIHKSYGLVAGNDRPVLSQGLVVATAEGVLLVDTAWTDEDTARLLTLIESEAADLPELAIVTHAHGDKMGGMNALYEARVASRAHPLTNIDAPARGLRPAAMTLLDKDDFDTLFGLSENGRSEAGPVAVYYPGPAHTRDNIVVYHAPSKVLFAGCLIRPPRARDMGNTADGDLDHWAEAVRKIAARFPEAEIVVPSHGPSGGRELLDHTITLAEAAREAR